MSQEVNPYLVTSIISATRMPEDYTQNSMKEKHKQRIMDEEKAYLKKSTLRLMHPGKHKNKKTNPYTNDESCTR